MRCHGVVSCHGDIGYRGDDDCHGHTNLEVSVVKGGFGPAGLDENVGLEAVMQSVDLTQFQEDDPR